MAKTMTEGIWQNAYLVVLLVKSIPNVLPKCNVAIIISFICFPRNLKFNSTFCLQFLRKTGTFSYWLKMTEEMTSEIYEFFYL